MSEQRTIDPMMQPCRRGCGELVHLENDGFHVCREQRSSNPLVAELREDSEWASLAMRMGLRRRAADEIERQAAKIANYEEIANDLNEAIIRLTAELTAERKRLGVEIDETMKTRAERDRLAAENEERLRRNRLIQDQNDRLKATVEELRTASAGISFRW